MPFSARQTGQTVSCVDFNDGGLRQTRAVLASGFGVAVAEGRAAGILFKILCGFSIVVLYVHRGGAVGILSLIAVLYVR
jgi:hypothetical protein